MSNVLFADAPVSAPVAGVPVTPVPRDTRSWVALRRPSAYLRAIDSSLGAPTAGSSAYLRAIDPSGAAVTAVDSPYLRAIAGHPAR